jgi:ATP-binding cassette subfamily A (ABC1) protein 3
MKMMGLTDFSYWSSWFTYYFLVVTIISIVCTIILSFNVVKYSNRPLIFLLFWLYGMSLFGLIAFFSSIFSNSRVGAIAGTLIYFGSSFIDRIVSD